MLHLWNLHPDRRSPERAMLRGAAQARRRGGLLRQLSLLPLQRGSAERTKSSNLRSFKFKHVK